MNIFATAPTCWAPSLTTKEDWEQWADGSKTIEKTHDAPKLEYTPPLFRRRLSQISRMTIQVVHQALESKMCDTAAKLVFASNRGEINREFTINKQLIEEKQILPASFSLSVFNTPIALASLAFQMKDGYSVIFPSKGNFSSVIKAAFAPVICGHDKEILFVYADELVPEEYGTLRPLQNEPLAFATLISSEKKDSNFILNEEFYSEKNPADFLRKLIGQELDRK